MKTASPHHMMPGSNLQPTRIVLRPIHGHEAAVDSSRRYRPSTLNKTGETDEAQRHIRHGEPNKRPRKQPPIIPAKCHIPPDAVPHRSLPTRYLGEPLGCQCPYERLDIRPCPRGLDVVLIKHSTNDLLLARTFDQQLPDPGSDWIKTEVHAALDIQQNSFIAEYGIDH
jgi:hypothetical protein